MYRKNLLSLILFPPPTSLTSSNKLKHAQNTTNQRTLRHIAITSKPHIIVSLLKMQLKLLFTTPPPPPPSQLLSEPFHPPSPPQPPLKSLEKTTSLPSTMMLSTPLWPPVYTKPSKRCTLNSGTAPQLPNTESARLPKLHHQPMRPTALLTT